MGDTQIIDSESNQRDVDACESKWVTRPLTFIYAGLACDYHKDVGSLPESCLIPLTKSVGLT